MRYISILQQAPRNMFGTFPNASCTRSPAEGTHDCLSSYAMVSSKQFCQARHMTMSSFSLSVLGLSIDPSAVAQTNRKHRTLTSSLEGMAVVTRMAACVSDLPVSARRMPTSSFGTLGSITPGVSIRKAVGRSPTLHQHSSQLMCPRQLTVPFADAP